MNEVGKTYERPWGSYKTLELKPGFQVKTVTANPGGRLSLQSHAHREEHWVVVSGSPTITVNENVRVYQVGEKVTIPVGAKHRLENFATEPATIVEVQLGDYLGEDDIVRYDDMYGRQS